MSLSFAFFNRFSSFQVVELPFICKFYLNVRAGKKNLELSIIQIIKSNLRADLGDTIIFPVEVDGRLSHTPLMSHELTLEHSLVLRHVSTPVEDSVLTGVM